MAELVNETDSPDAVLILHGGSAGVESSFIKKTFEAAKRHGFNVLAYDFPYLEKPDKKPSEDFIEEAETVKDALTRLQIQGARHIHVVAKSVGSAILSQALRDSDEFKVERVTIMGLPIGLTDLNQLSNTELYIVQGSQDRFGPADGVKKELSKAGIKANISEIIGATHSFRDSETDTKPVYEDEAIEMINWVEL